MGLTYLLVAEASSNETAALYASLSAVVVALIGGAVAVLTARQRPAEPPSVRLVDEQTTHALPREMADMLVDVIAERDRHKDRGDLWEQRARELGWAEP